nr:MAG TPA_asm: hypothetical protein [Bacteriophage sp.]DAP05633.1 MAG TPA: hypothetical protein [Caudoviricetes sp.]
MSLFKSLLFKVYSRISSLIVFIYCFIDECYNSIRTQFVLYY